MIAETIIAIATPRGEGGLGIVRLSGQGAVNIGRELFFSRPPLGSKPRYIHYGTLMDGKRELDQGLAWFLKSPRSFTGEDTVEISAHGSNAVLESVLHGAIAQGAVLAAPGEFTRRAFLNGRLDLAQAEAVVEIIRAGSRSTLADAYSLACGQLSALVDELKQILLSCISNLELGLDFPEEDNDEAGYNMIKPLLQQVLRKGESLIETFEGARRRQEGFAVCLLGRPNAGKSTLLNCLLGEDRAIVSNQPGTTRDVIEGRTLWCGESIRLIDTAGFHDTAHSVERMGVERARRTVAEADLALVVIDSCDAWSTAHAEMLAMVDGKPAVWVLNKSDLEGSADNLPQAIQAPKVRVSALLGEGMVELRNAAMGQLSSPRRPEGVAILRERHHDCLQTMVNSVSAAIRMISRHELAECIVVELHSGISSLAEILGEEVDEQVLDRIFAEFCIGK